MERKGKWVRHRRKELGEEIIDKSRRDMKGQGRIPLPSINYIGRRKAREIEAHIPKHAQKRKKIVK